MREPAGNGRTIRRPELRWGWPAAGAALGFALAFAAAAADPVRLNADTWILRDFHTGAVLSEQDADRRVEPASLVKLMTAYAAFSEIAEGELALDESVTVSRKAWKMGGSQTFIEVGTQVSVEQLLKGIIVQSGNDASVALAEHVGGTEEAFVQLMNEHAARLGMTGTRYANSHGLPHADNFTTARDVAILLRALMADFPEKYKWHTLREFTYGGITQQNRNRLLRRDPSVDGGKTGFTNAARYCLAASANRDGMRVIAVVMGSPSSPERFRATQALINFGYRNYRTILVHAAREPIRTAQVWSGASASVETGIAEDLWLTVARRRVDEVDTRITLEDPVVAPVADGARLGRLDVLLGEEKLAEHDLVALAEVPQGSFYRQAVDWLRLLWR